MLKRLSAFALASYCALLGLLIFGSFDLLNTSWPFELFISYSRDIMIGLPIAAGLALWFWRPIIVPLSAILFGLALWAFWPVITFSKYQTPSRQSCENTQCLTLYSANLKIRMDAFYATQEAAVASNADIITLFEVHRKLSLPQIKIAFADYPYIIFLNKDLDGVSQSYRMALLSRYPLSLAPNSPPIPRGLLSVGGDRFISAFVQTGTTPDLQVIAVHPVSPRTPNMTWNRDIVLEAAIRSIQTKDKFIMMGDFNTTPWAPAYQKLPGRRAGDPRFLSTWHIFRPFLGIPIDHIIVGDDLQIVDAKLEPPTLSDHLPIMATVLIK